MSKLTKSESKLHTQACRLLEKDSLTYDEKVFVLDNWQEGAKHINSLGRRHSTHAAPHPHALPDPAAGYEPTSEDLQDWRLSETEKGYLGILTIYNSEKLARDRASRIGLDHEHLDWHAVIDAIEEWEEEFC